MLNKAERLKILKLIQNCCTVGHLPAVVDTASWKLLQHSSTGRRRWPSLTYFGFFALHALYKNVTLISACFFQESTPLYQLVIHALLALCAPIISFWYYQLYINHPGTFSRFLGMTLTGNIGGTIVKTTETTNLLPRFKAYTIQEFLVINLAHMIRIAMVAVIGICICYPTLQFLLYAGLPQQFQTWQSFTLLLLEETRYLFMIYAVAVPVWTLQLMSFDLVNNQLKALFRSVGRTNNRDKLERTYSSLRHIQLYVTMTNVVNRYIIFSWKILCIGTCIGTGYAAIAHFSDYPIFGVMYYVLLIDGTFIYTVSYGQAFKIPALFEQVAQLAIFRLRLLGCADLHILKRRMRSIPRVGIKVGEFHVLERESTPTFVHFVLGNIVTMLVAYQH